jgi:trans-aconitate methyltransferase
VSHLDPALFYSDLVAQLYRPLRSQTPDPDPYARFVERSGQPALELGCGDGDPLLDLRARGLDVEGLDSSPDMLTRCRDAARARGLDVVLHQQTMQTMSIARRFASIFIAGPTFNLLPDDDTALQSLAGIRAHLEPDGSALIPLFIPSPTPPSQLGQPRVVIADDGTEMRVTAVSEHRDEPRRVQSTTLRYELITDIRQTVVDRPWLVHWHTQDGSRILAADAGLTVRAVVTPNGNPATPDDQTFVFLLTRTVDA